MFICDRVHVCTPCMYKSPWKSEEVVGYPGTYNCELKWMLGAGSGSFTRSITALNFEQYLQLFSGFKVFYSCNLLSAAFRSNLI